MREFWIALSAKVRVTFRATITARSRLVAILGVAACIVFALGLAVPTYKAMADLSNSHSLTTAQLTELTNALSVVGLVLVLIVINTDIFTAQTMDLGQRTKDIEFLQLLPMGFSTFFLLKVCERALTDIVALGLLLPVMLGMGAGVAGPLGFVVAVVDYLLVVVAISALLVALQFTLTRFFPLSALKAIVNWLSLGSMLLFFGIPILILDYDLLNALPSDFLLRAWWQYVPSTWYTGVIVQLHQAPKQALYYFAGTLLATVIALASAYGLTSLFRHIGWSYAAGSRRHSFTGWKRWFRGYVWKELLMLRRDKNILVNGVFLPLCVTGLVLHNWSSLGVILGDSLHTILMIVSCGLLYFHLFGAINAVGAEGRAIGLLSMLPLSPRRFLTLKILLWGGLGAALFVTIFLGYLASALSTTPPLTHTVGAVCWLVFLSFLIASLGVGLSLHFVNYEAKFLQQASTMTGKLVMLLFSARAVYALSMDDRARAAISILFLSLFAGALLFRAAVQLSYPHETNLPRTGGAALADSLIVVFILGLIGPIVTMSVNALWYENTAPLSASLISMALCDIAAVIAAIIVFRRSHPQVFGSIGLTLDASSLSIGFVVGLCLGYAARGYLTVLPLLGVSLPATVFTTEQLLLFFGSVCVIVPLCEEILIRGLLHRSLQEIVGRGRVAILTSALFFALLHPLSSFPPVYLLGIVLAYLYDKTECLPACILLHVTYNIVVSLPQVAPALYY